METEREDDNLAHRRRLEEMQRELELKKTELANLQQTRMAEVIGDEELKAVRSAAHEDRETIIKEQRLRRAQLDVDIRALELDIERQEANLRLEIEKRERNLVAEDEDKDLERALKAFEVVQERKLKRIELQKKTTGTQEAQGHRAAGDVPETAPSPSQPSGHADRKPFSVCPYCREKLGLPKMPNYCPFCGERLR